MIQVLIWFLIAILAGIFEVITVDLVSIWIAVGALVAMVLAWLDYSITIQLIAVLVVSVSLGIITRPICKKLLRGNVLATNSDRLIGKTGVITKSFSNDGRGEIKIVGEYWTCTSKQNHTYSEGDQVTVLAIEGVKLIVVPKN